jgi:hypothetical protein
MALVREHAAYGGFDSAEAAAFDGLGSGHDALLGLDAAALFAGGRFAGAAAYVAGGGMNTWACSGSASVLAFDRATAAVGDEECDAWIDAMDQSDGAAAAPEPRHAPAASVGFDAATGCFTLTERASSSGGVGRPFGLLFPSTSSSSSSPERAAPARASQKRAYVVSAAITARFGNSVQLVGRSDLCQTCSSSRVHAGCGTAGRQCQEAVRREQEDEQGQVGAHRPDQGPAEPRGQGKFGRQN